jgi:rhodanese-related sulfurtransferase
MRAMGMAVRESVGASKIDDEGGRALVHLNNGETITADTVVLATGVTPDTALFAEAGVVCERGFIVVDGHGKTNLDDVYAVGDATLSRDAITKKDRPNQLAGPANRAGRLVADALGPRGARDIPTVLGTAILRMGKLTAAMTGANRGALEDAGISYTTIHVHPANHAGYFPGGSQMHLIVHIDPTTGRILGAQGVGQDGVDKRIDVLATAIRGGLTAADLIDIDLCYSPPFGSAKDPITMIGFVADNVLSEQTSLWYPEQLEWARSSALVLDVRTAKEFATGHLPEAVNIPHVELRGRLEEVRALAGDRPIAVMCQSGVRSYIAHRILAGNGFTSQSLSGGMLTLRAWLGDEASTVLTNAV